MRAGTWTARRGTPSDRQQLHLDRPRPMQSRYRRYTELAALERFPESDAGRTPFLQATNEQPSASQQSMASLDLAQPPAPSNWQWILTLCTVAIFICYADRSNISVAIVEMANEFSWDEAYQGTILSVFFVGYAGTQLIGGTLADRYGGKAVLAAGVLTWSMFTFLTPDAAMGGSATLISCRIAMGLVVQGIAFPAMHSLISSAVPRSTQSTAVAIVTAASYGGNAFASGVAPWIIDQYSWPMVFYVFGASALLWMPFWLAIRPPGNFAAATPDCAAATGTVEVSAQGQSGEGASPAEARAPASSDGAADRDGEGLLASDVPEASISRGSGVLGLDRAFWGLAKRKEVWAICAAQYCQSWGMYALLSWLPTFFSEQYHVDISDLGKYTLVPPLLQAVVGGFSGAIADGLIDRGFSVKLTRQVLQVVGMLGPAGCLLLSVSPTLKDMPSAATALITAAQGFAALTLGAVSVSQLDIAPKHAGTVFGLGNTFATVAGLLSTRLTGDILQQTHSWPLVFAVTSVHYVVGAVIWVVWVGSEPLLEDEW